MLIREIKGSDVLPKQVNTAGSKHPDIINQVDGYNRAIDDINDIDISGDVDVLAKILMDEYDDDDNWDDNSESAKRKHKWWMGNAKEIISKMPQWLVMRKGK